MDLKQFKEELRGKITDFAVSSDLVNLKSIEDEKKAKMVEEMYKKLEKWVIEQLDF